MKQLGTGSLADLLADRFAVPSFLVRFNSHDRLLRSLDDLPCVEVPPPSIRRIESIALSLMIIASGEQSWMQGENLRTAQYKR